MMDFPKDISLRCVRSDAGVWYITSSWHTGLVIAHPDLAEGLKLVPTVMLNIISAEPKPAT